MELFYFFVVVWIFCFSFKIKGLETLESTIIFCSGMYNMVCRQSPNSWKGQIIFPSSTYHFIGNFFQIEPMGPNGTRKTFEIVPGSK